MHRCSYSSTDEYKNVQLTGQAECRIRYEHGTEPSEAVKFLEPLDYISHYQLFKQDFAPMS